MTDSRKRLVTAVSISLVVHLLLLTLSYIYFDGLLYSPPEEEIIEIDLRSDDWKIADIMPPKIEKRPEKAKHIGIYDSKADQETVSDETVRAPGRPVKRGGEGIEDLKEKVDNIFKSDKYVELKPEQLDMGMPRRKLPEDFYPDYKRGPHTYINVMKHADVGYFVRLKRVFKLAWDPTPVLMRRRMGGEISRGNIKVVLGLAIDKSGEINELFVINSSGMEDYDEEAIRAVRASSPFSTPPDKLLAKDGILRVSWTFVVYM